jgi:hypothetical protein
VGIAIVAISALEGFELFWPAGRTVFLGEVGGLLGIEGSLRAGAGVNFRWHERRRCVPARRVCPHHTWFVLVQQLVLNRVIGSVAAAAATTPVLSVNGSVRQQIMPADVIGRRPVYEQQRCTSLLTQKRLSRDGTALVFSWGSPCASTCLRR